MGFDWGSHFWHSVFIWATGVAAIFGGIGVIAAFVAGMVGYQVTEFSLDKSRKDQQSANVEIAKAHSKTAELAADAEKSRALIAEANARAAVATQKAEEANLERLKLEQRLAPRTLSLAQQDELSKRWKRSDGSSPAIDILIFPAGTADIGSLAAQIVRTFKLSDWQVRSATHLSSQSVAGVLMGLEDGSSNSIRDAAQMIADDLNAAGISTTLGRMFPNTPIPLPTSGDSFGATLAPIRMHIGSKP